MASTGDDLPVIDMVEGTPERIVEQAAAACRSWGSFQVINHGVVVDDARAQSRLLFALPTAQKLKARRMPGRFCGYGNGAVNAETLNAEYCSEAVTLGFRSSDAEAIGGKLWPEGNPAFCKSVTKFSAAAHDVSLKILGYMVDGLPEASRGHFKEYLVEQSGTLRVNNYPSCPQPGFYTGLPPHIDASVLTILHQSSADAPGLEIEKDGFWVGVQPRDDALVVIVGAIVQVLTNGLYEAVKHRALLNAERSRLSLAYSAYPPPNLSIVPASEFVSNDKPSPYRPFSWADFLAAKQKHEGSHHEIFKMTKSHELWNFHLHVITGSPAIWSSYTLSSMESTPHGTYRNQLRTKQEPHHLFNHAINLLRGFVKLQRLRAINNKDGATPNYSWGFRAGAKISCLRLAAAVS